MPCLRATLIAILAVACAALLTRTLVAAGDPNAAKGLVAEHCADCHAVTGAGSRESPLAEAPPFRTMAADPVGYPEQRLRQSLRQTHWPMTQLRLSPSDIDNIIAYLKSMGPQ